MRRVLCVPAISMAGWLFAACVGDLTLPPASDDAPDEVAAESSALYANADYYWAGVPPMIPICWENPSGANAAGRTWVRDAVESSWQRFARVNFTEWDTCASGDPGIHILITTSGGGAFPHGSELDGVTNGARLNLNGSEAGIRGLSHHEFGHGIGFYHEEERPDYSPGSASQPVDRNANGTPDHLEPDCAEQSYPNSDPRYFGAFDIRSVMSYCGRPMTGWSALSPGDVAAVQRAYGRRLAGSLVSTGGNCLAAHADAPNGETVFLWDCDEAYDDQEWSFDGTHLYLESDRCLENEYWSNQPGDSLILYTCSTYSTQRWSFEQVAVRGWGGMCLDLHAGDTTPGTNIQMWECDALGGANQRWTITESGQIKFGGPESTSCVTASGSSVYIHNCDYPYYQEFEFLPSGQIRPKHWTTPKCFDVQGWWDSDYTSGVGLPGNGQNVQLFDCYSGQYNQKWNLSGRLVHEHTGLCVERPGGSEANGTVPELRACDGGEAQVWDYYFK